MHLWEYTRIYSLGKLMPFHWYQCVRYFIKSMVLHSTPCFFWKRVPSRSLRLAFATLGPALVFFWIKKSKPSGESIISHYYSCLAKKEVQTDMFYVSTLSMNRLFSCLNHAQQLLHVVHWDSFWIEDVWIIANVLVCRSKRTRISTEKLVEFGRHVIPWSTSGFYLSLLTRNVNIVTRKKKTFHSMYTLIKNEDIEPGVVYLLYRYVWVHVLILFGNH